MLVNDNFIKIDFEIIYGLGSMPCLVLLAKIEYDNQFFNLIVNHTSDGCYVTFNSNKCMHHFTINESAHLMTITDNDINTLRRKNMPAAQSLFLYNYVFECCLMKCLGL